MPYRWLAGKYPPFGSIHDVRNCRVCERRKTSRGDGGTVEERTAMNTKEMPNESMWHLERLANSYYLMDRARKDASEYGHKILVEVKEAFGWTQTYMAEQVGVNKYHMSRIFRKQEPVSVKLLTRLYDVIIAEEGTKSRGGEGVTVQGTGTGGTGGDAGKQDLERVG